MTIEIPLTRGLVALVDEQDWNLTQFKWHARYSDGKFYAGRNVPGTNHNIILMHRQILGFPKLVDHKNGNGLDNRRCNIRVATDSENNINKPNPRPGMRGVYARGSKWIAQIQFEKKQHYLGTFHELKDALLAYDRAAIELHGEFAQLNCTHKHPLIYESHNRTTRSHRRIQVAGLHG